MAGARRGRGGGGRSRRSAPGVSWDPPDLYTPAHAGRRTHLPSHLARRIRGGRDCRIAPFAPTAPMGSGVTPKGRISGPGAADSHTALSSPSTTCDLIFRTRGD